MGAVPAPACWIPQHRSAPRVRVRPSRLTCPPASLPPPHTHRQFLGPLLAAVTWVADAARAVEGLSSAVFHEFMTGVVRALNGVTDTSAVIGAMGKDAAVRVGGCWGGVCGRQLLHYTWSVRCF